MAGKSDKRSLLAIIAAAGAILASMVALVPKIFPVKMEKGEVSESKTMPFQSTTTFVESGINVVLGPNEDGGRTVDITLSSGGSDVRCVDKAIGGPSSSDWCVLVIRDLTYEVKATQVVDGGNIAVAVSRFKSSR